MHLISLFSSNSFNYLFVLPWLLQFFDIIFQLLFFSSQFMFWFYRQTFTDNKIIAVFPTEISLFSFRFILGKCSHKTALCVDKFCSFRAFHFSNFNHRFVICRNASLSLFEFFSHKFQKFSKTFRDKFCPKAIIFS